MKKILVTLLLVGIFGAFGTPALAKTLPNSGGSTKVDWNLSGAVMPVPPYGSKDIEGSDVMSKLFVIHPYKKCITSVMGLMKGLHANTEYTVYMSNGYEVYKPASVLGDWKWTVLGTYVHDVKITTQNPDGTFSGTAGYPSGAVTYDTTEVITGKIEGNNVTFTTTYDGPYNPGYTATAVGHVNPDGSMSGNTPWSWSTSVGAYKPAKGDTSWTGFLPGVEAFTFKTDKKGMAIWSYSFKDDDSINCKFFKNCKFNFGRIKNCISKGICHYDVIDGVVDDFSVWINEGGYTVLISDTVKL